MLKKALLSLLCLGLVVLVPACGHKDGDHHHHAGRHHHHGKAVEGNTVTTEHKEKKTTKTPKEKTKTTKKEKTTTGKYGKKTTKSETKEIMPAMNVDVYEDEMDEEGNDE